MGKFRGLPEDIALLVTAGNLWAIVIGAAAGGIIFGLTGELAEEGRTALPRLEPLFASSSGSVTFLFAVAGASLGALIAALATLKPAHGRQEKRFTILQV